MKNSVLADNSWDTGMFSVVVTVKTIADEAATEMLTGMYAIDRSVNEVVAPTVMIRTSMKLAEVPTVNDVVADTVNMEPSPFTLLRSASA